jgi:hypothetical protein
MSSTIGKRAKHSRQFSPQPGPSRLCHLYVPSSSPPPPQSSESDLEELLEQSSQDLVMDSGISNDRRGSGSNDSTIEFDEDGIYFILYSLNGIKAVLQPIVTFRSSCHSQQALNGSHVNWSPAQHQPCRPGLIVDMGLVKIKRAKHSENAKSIGN